MRMLKMSTPIDPRPRLSLTVNKYGWADDMPERNWEPTIFVFVKLGEHWHPLDAQDQESELCLCLSGIGFTDVKDFIQETSKTAANAGFAFECDDEFWADLAEELGLDLDDLDFSNLRAQVPNTSIMECLSNQNEYDQKATTMGG